MKKSYLLALFLSPIHAATLHVATLPLKRMEVGFGKPKAGKSIDGNGLKIGGKAFADGIGTHAESVFPLKLDGKATEFRASVGVDDETGGKGSVEFKLIGDGREIWSSGTMKGGQKAAEAKVSLAGVKELLMVVDSADGGIDFDHADWADAEIDYDGAAPAVGKLPSEEAVVLTPKPGPKPRLTGARIFGARPGNPFLHRVSATGTKPVKFSASGLPPGISLDESTGALSGKLAADGKWDVKITASNAAGEDQRTLRIVGGETIALTPPIGWNSWNCFAGAVTDPDIRAAARSMVSSGLADHGWTYINIDDYWEVKPSAKNDASLQGPERDADGKIEPNPRFPDMKALASDVHGLGLKIGL